MSSPSDPTPITEAAGLLATGVIFPRRVGLQRVDDPAGAADILLGFKRGGFSIYLGDDPLFHFDLDGRWQRAFVAGTHYLKGLDTQVRAVERVREGGSMVLRRRTLAAAEATRLDATIADQARSLGADLTAGRYNLVAPPAPSRSITSGDLGATLGRIAAWDAAAWDAHRARYRLAYGVGPAPFLPPDCPNPVVLLADGSVSPVEFAARARAVAALLGARLNGCRDVFLAGPDWLDRPEGDVLALLAATNEVFPIRPLQGRPRALDAGADAPRLETIHGWLDAIPANPPTAAIWARFRAAHLGRITLRVDARALPDLDQLGSTVAHLKAAGIGVSLAVFLTPSSSLDDPAIRQIAAGDLILLIAADEAGVDPSPPRDPEFLAPIRDRIIAALPPGARGPRVVVYNPDKQWI